MGLRRKKEGEGGIGKGKRGGGLGETVRGVLEMDNEFGYLLGAGVCHRLVREWEKRGWGLMEGYEFLAGYDWVLRRGGWGERVKELVGYEVEVGGLFDLLKGREGGGEEMSYGEFKSGVLGLINTKWNSPLRFFFFFLVILIILLLLIIPIILIVKLFF